MSPELQALAERVVKSKHWRWVPGMLAVDPQPELWTLKDGSTPDRVTERYPDQHAGEGWDAWLPDLADPCTLGGLLSLVRAAFDCATIQTVTMRWPDSIVWIVTFHGAPGSVAGVHDTEAAALVEALLAAP